MLLQRFKWPLYQHNTYATAYVWFNSHPSNSSRAQSQAICDNRFVGQLDNNVVEMQWLLRLWYEPNHPAKLFKYKTHKKSRHRVFHPLRIIKCKTRQYFKWMPCNSIGTAFSNIAEIYSTHFLSIIIAWHLKQ